jgi:hypothetical protein
MSAMDAGTAEASFSVCKLEPEFGTSTRTLRCVADMVLPHHLTTLSNREIPAFVEQEAHQSASVTETASATQEIPIS